MIVRCLLTFAFCFGVAACLLAQSPAESKKVADLTYSGVVFPMRRVTMQPNLVSSQQSARVVKVDFQEGDMVKKGHLLVQLDDREPAIIVKIYEQSVELDKVSVNLYDRNAEYAGLENKRAIAGDDAFAQSERDKALYNYDLAKIQVEQQKAKMVADALQVEQARIRLDDYRILAPFDGVITMKAVEEGQSVENTAKVCEIMEVSTVVIQVNVENEYYHAINEGNKATVKVEVLPNRKFDAVVFNKAPMSDPRSKTFVLKVKVDNKDNAIKPGWYAEVIFPPQVAAKKTGN